MGFRVQLRKAGRGCSAAWAAGLYLKCVADCYVVEPLPCLLMLCCAALRPAKLCCARCAAGTRQPGSACWAGTTRGGPCMGRMQRAVTMRCSWKTCRQGRGRGQEPMGYGPCRGKEEGCGADDVTCWRPIAWSATCWLVLNAHIFTIKHTHVRHAGCIMPIIRHSECSAVQTGASDSKSGG